MWYTKRLSYGSGCLPRYTGDGSATYLPHVVPHVLDGVELEVAHLALELRAALAHVPPVAGLRVEQLAALLADQRVHHLVQLLRDARQLKYTQTDKLKL